MKMKLIVIFTIVAVIFGESAWATLEDQSKGPARSSISTSTSTANSTTSNTTKTSTTETTKSTTKSTSKTPTKTTTTAKPITKSTSKTPTKKTTTLKPTTKSTSKTPTKKTTTVKPITKSTSKTPTKTTTTAKTTTKSTSKTPTKATTTAKPATKSTSKTPITATTTAKPATKSTSKTPTTVTTPTKPTKPTQHPTPTSPPPYGKFSLKENNNSYCILAEFAAIFSITYVKKDSSSSTTPTKATTTAKPTSKTPTKATTTAKPTSKTPTKATTTAKPTSKTPTKATTTAKSTTKSTTKSTSKTKLEVHLNSSSHVDITGNCGTSTTNAILKISWPKNETFYTLIMEFQNSSSSHSWSVISIVFNVTVEGNPAFENITDVGKYVSSVYNESAVPHGRLGGDYLCKDAQSITFKNNEMHFEVKSAFTDMRIEPFVHKTKADAFDKDGTVQCPSHHTPSPTKSSDNNVVPIAVGCALAGLVLIVLIAYVIGRRKSPSGYEKV